MYMCIIQWQIKPIAFNKGNNVVKCVHIGSFAETNISAMKHCIYLMPIEQTHFHHIGLDHEMVH